MEPYIITFLGNKEVKDREAVLKTLVSFLQGYFIDDIDTLLPRKPVFYCGGYGEFSQIAAEAIDILRERNPELESEKLFITPYITPSYMKTIEYMKEFYDEVVYPPLENVPPQYAISRRNQWMIDKCDMLITYKEYPCGNTRKCIDYAIRKGKLIFCVDAEKVIILRECI